MNKLVLSLMFLFFSFTLEAAENRMVVNLNDNTSESFSIDEIDKMLIVKSIITVQSVSIDTDQLELNVDDTQQLKYSIVPDNASNQNVIWESSNENVATVDNEGLITAISSGETTITIETADGGYQDELNVVVSQITSVEISSNDIKIYPNPIQNKLFIDIDDSRRFEAIICDISGNVLYSQFDEKEIDLHNFPAGNYFLTLIASNKYYNFKLIKN